MDRLLTETVDNVKDGYYYDALSNRTGIDSGDNYNIDISYKYGLNKKMELKKYTAGDVRYDKNGNMIKKYIEDVDYWFYTYDENNRLVVVKRNGIDDKDSAGVVGKYVYDSNGLRIKKREGPKTTYYVYNG